MPTRSPADPKVATRTHARGGVLSVGAASLFSDASHESVTSLLPQFLTTTMHTGPGVLGLIDGFADALAGLSKLVGGRLAAEPARRSRVATSGYVSTAVATALIGMTTAVWQVAALRGFAWIARGLRTPARDMLLTDLARRGQFGKAFGVERAGDNAGAVLGPVMASGLVVIVGVRTSMLLSIIPGVLAALAITFAARRTISGVWDGGRRVRLAGRLRELRGHGMRNVLLPIGAFEMGNLASTLLILRATGLLAAGNRSTTAAAGLAVLLYAAHNAVASLSALGAGWVIDRSTAAGVLMIGAGCYVASYLLFGVGPNSTASVVLSFVLAGVGIGCGETAEGALVARTLPRRMRAQGLGLLGLVQAIGDIGATVVAGLLWTSLGPGAAFAYAAGWMVVAIGFGCPWRDRQRGGPRRSRSRSARR